MHLGSIAPRIYKKWQHTCARNDDDGSICALDRAWGGTRSKPLSNDILGTQSVNGESKNYVKIWT